MYDLVTEKTTQDSSMLEREKARCDKLLWSKKASNVLYNKRDDGLSCSYFANGFKENISQLEIDYVDNTGNIYTIRSDESTLKAVRIFVDDNKVFMAYRTDENDPQKYCSWGYKKPSATMAKLSVFFKTDDETGFIYVDAQHPEHQILLISESEKDWDIVQNTYDLIKSLKLKEAQGYETIG